MRQVFSNLIANSLDAIDEHGTIKLRISKCTLSKDGCEKVRVTIADDGKGISPDTLPRLFEPFFTTKGTIGTGLGLWVSKKIVDAHGGTIRVRSCNDGARRVTFSRSWFPPNPVALLSRNSHRRKGVSLKARCRKRVNKPAFIYN